MRQIKYAQVALVVFLVGCTPSTRGPDSLPDEAIASIDAIVETAVRETPLAGLTVAVRVGQDPAHTTSYGYAEISTLEPAGDETVYQIASITKMFTAASIMQLVEQGRIDLEKPVIDYVPTLPEWGQSIRVRHLLNHTSGLPDISELEGIDFSRQYAPEEVLKVLFEGCSGPEFEPGAQYRYSSTGYLLLGIVIEQVTGVSYGEYLQQNISDSLGLNFTAYCQMVSENIAHGYRVSEGNLYPVESSNISLAYAAGGVCSTASDLIAWQQHLEAGHVVSADLYQEMTTPLTLPSGESLRYGYGIAVGEYSGAEAVGHNGRTTGFEAVLVRFPVDDLTIVVLTNTNPSNPEMLTEIVATIRDVVLGER